MAPVKKTVICQVQDEEEQEEEEEQVLHRRLDVVQRQDRQEEAEEEAQRDGADGRDVPLRDDGGRGSLHSTGWSIWSDRVLG